MTYGWIKASDRLPPIGEVVWLYENGSIYTGGRADCEDGWLWGMCYQDAYWLDDDGWIGEIMADSRYKPTHWMPKPMPPDVEQTIADGNSSRGGQATRQGDRKSGVMKPRYYPTRKLRVEE